MDHVLATSSHSAASRPGPLRRLLRGIAMGRSRHRLGELDDHLLRDIGLTRDQARQEADRASWDAPSHWFR
jgi:uncharacterized protein YjiS (DUF1127 family)